MCYKCDFDFLISDGSVGAGRPQSLEHDHRLPDSLQAEWGQESQARRRSQRTRSVVGDLRDNRDANDSGRSGFRAEELLHWEKALRHIEFEIDQFYYIFISVINSVLNNCVVIIFISVVA